MMMSEDGCTVRMPAKKGTKRYHYCSLLGHVHVHYH